MVLCVCLEFRISCFEFIKLFLRGLPGKFQENVFEVGLFDTEVVRDNAVFRQRDGRQR